MNMPARASRPPMPELLAFLGRHLAVGAGAGVAFATALLLTNTAGLKELIFGGSDALVALVLLYAFNALTFASVSMGAAVMMLPMDKPCDMRERNFHEPG